MHAAEAVSCQSIIFMAVLSGGLVMATSINTIGK